MDIMDNKGKTTNAIKESKLIEGCFISDGMIHNKDFSALTEDVSVEQLPLSLRSYNCIRRAGIHTLAKLLQTSIEELASIKNMGAKSMEEILSVTKKYLYERIGYDIDKKAEYVDESQCYDTMALPIEDSSVCDDTNELLMEDIPLGRLSLSLRTSNALARCGYQYVNEIAAFTYDDFKQIKSMGDKCAREIYEKVRAFLKEYRESSEAHRITPDGKAKS